MIRNGTIDRGNQTDDPDNTTDVENQVVYTYNNLSQITESEQSHSGVVGGSTPSVQYTYSTSVNGSQVGPAVPYTSGHRASAGEWSFVT